MDIRPERWTAYQAFCSDFTKAGLRRSSIAETGSALFQVGDRAGAPDRAIKATRFRDVE